MLVSTSVSIVVIISLVCMKFNLFFVISLFSEHMDIDPKDTAPALVTEPAEDTAPALVKSLKLGKKKNKEAVVGCCKIDAELS